MIDEALRYVSGLLEPNEQEAFEQRMFADDAVGADVARAMAMIDAVRQMATQGPIVPVVLPAELHALASTTTVSEWHPIDGRIESHIEAEEFIVAHVPVSTDAAHVHVLFCTPDGTPYFRVNQAPFEPSAREVLVLCKRHVALATQKLIVRVVDDDDRPLAEVSVENRPPMVPFRG